MKYEMFFAGWFISLCFTPGIRSVKLIIDGTIDFGPSWDLKYKIKTFPNFESKETISIIPDAVPSSNEKYSSNDSDRKNNVQNKGYIARTAINDSQSEQSVEVSASQEGNKVTYLFKTMSKTTKFFIRPRRIGDDKTVTDFMQSVYNKSLEIFEVIFYDTDVEEIAQKIQELKDRFKTEFRDFMNKTIELHIKTALGTKKVVLDIIDHAKKLLDRLANRFKIDTEHNLRNGRLITELFRKEIDRVRAQEYKDACRTFNICRIGNEYSDFISDLMTILLKAVDVKIQMAIQAFVKEMKKVNVSKIMDNETTIAFHKDLSITEERNADDNRLLLLGYLLLLKNKHLPIYNQTPEGSWIQQLVATYYVIESFNENIKMTGHNKEWGDRMVNKLKDWVFSKNVGSGAASDKSRDEVTHIAKDLVHHFETEGIAKFDKNTSRDLISNFRILLLQNPPPNWLRSLGYLDRIA